MADEPQETAGSARTKALRATLKDLLLHDPEIRALFAPPPAPEAPAAPAPPPIEPDAALGQWVQGLVEGKLRLHLRPEAFRRPL